MKAADDYQRRAGEEGRQVQSIAGKVLRGSGFVKLRRNQRLPDLGVLVNFIAEDSTGTDWFFDVSGAFTSKRAGLIRTDTMWKTLGRASVLHQSGVERLVLMTTNLPKADSTGRRALRAAAETFFDAVEMLTPEGKARLALYGQGIVDRPLPGLRTAVQLYPGLTSRTIGTGLEVRVPIAEVSSALPERASVDLVVMPHRLKVFVPSKDSTGAQIETHVQQAAGERIRAHLSSFAGGCTVVPGLGTWLDPIGGEMLEDVILVESYSARPFPSRIVSDVLQVLVRDLGQHTAALIVNDAMVRVTPR